MFVTTGVKSFPYKVMFMVSMPGMEATVNAQGLEHVKTWVGFESTEISCPLSRNEGLEFPAICPSSDLGQELIGSVVAHPDLQTDRLFISPRGAFLLTEDQVDSRH